MMNDTYEHDRTVTAFFDTRAAADKAMVDVVAAGVPSGMVTITEASQPGPVGHGRHPRAQRHARRGFLGIGEEPVRPR